MKKWRCTVCAYIYEGEEAAEKCPVCGAGESQAEQIEKAVTESISEMEKGEIKKWRCMVCGYIHEGEKPPERCPICGAEKKLFEPVREEETAVEKSVERESTDTPETPEIKKRGLYSFLIRQMLENHAHPISVHIPNGILPVSLLFIIIAVLFQKPSTAVGMTVLEQAVFYYMIFVVISLPFVIFSGYVEWKYRYGGHLTRTFLIKMIAAGIMSVCAVSILVWWHIDPNVTGSQSSNRWNFVLLNMVMLVAAAIAGMIGGKLVFKD